jgi:hypothetical protein
MNKRNDGLESFPATFAFTKISVFSSDQSEVWANQIGTYWMDLQAGQLYFDLGQQNDPSLVSVPFSLIQSWNCSAGKHFLEIRSQC